MPERISGLLLLIVAALSLAQPAELLPASPAPSQLAWQKVAQPIGAQAVAAAAPPRMRVSAGAVTEGGILVYSIDMVPAIAKPVPVNYAFSGDLSALVDASGGSGRIPPGGALTVRRQTVDDSLVNSDRHVVLTAALPGSSQPQGDRFRASASGLVQDNDVAPPPPPPAPVLPQVAIGAARPMTEGNTLTFPLRLTKPTDRPVTVYFLLEDPNGVAAAGTVTSVTIAAGETTGKIPVDTIDDGTVNGLRPVTVRLLRASGAVLSKPASARGFVADNDVAPPPVSSYSISLPEPEVAEGGNLTFTVTRSGDLSQAGTISYSLTTAVEGKAGVPERTSLNFPPGLASRSFDYQPNGPILHDMLVQVILLQDGGEPRLSRRSAQGTIKDDPANPPKEDPVGPTETTSGGTTTGGTTSGGTTSGGASSGGPTIDHRTWYDPIDLGWPWSLIPIVVLVCSASAVAYRLLKPDVDPDPIPEPIADPFPPSPLTLPGCTIDCAPDWAAPQEPAAIGPLTLPELHFAITASLREPTTPYALGATFLEERDEPDDQL